MSGRYFDRSRADFVAPIGLEHFFDVFALEIQLDDIQSNLVVKQASARRFQLTPICAPDDSPSRTSGEALSVI